MLLGQITTCLPCALLFSHYATFSALQELLQTHYYLQQLSITQITSVPTNLQAERERERERKQLLLPKTGHAFQATISIETN